MTMRQGMRYAAAAIVAWGLTVREGECLEAGFDQWCKVE